MTASIYDHKAPVRTNTDPLNRTITLTYDAVGNDVSVFLRPPQVLQSRIGFG